MRVGFACKNLIFGQDNMGAYVSIFISTKRFGQQIKLDSIFYHLRRHFIGVFAAEVRRKVTTQLPGSFIFA
jgi:hypothetical protein